MRRDVIFKLIAIDVYVCLFLLTSRIDIKRRGTCENIIIVKSTSIFNSTSKKNIKKVFNMFTKVQKNNWIFFAKCNLMLLSA